MATTGAESMGRVTVAATLRNNEDVVMARKGLLNVESVRQVTIDGIVDTGAAHLVIPQSAALALGVPVLGTASVRYADRRQASRQVVYEVNVELLGRQGTFKAIVEPDRTDALIGAIVLEDLDFIVDCRRLELVPRDPEGLVSEIE